MSTSAVIDCNTKKGASFLGRALSIALGPVLSLLRAIAHSVERRSGRWSFGPRTLSPTANMVLAAVDLGAGGHVHGFTITSGEANEFILTFSVAGKEESLHYILVAAGSIVLISEDISLNGELATGLVTIENLNAGGAVTYQASILVKGS